MKKKSLYERSVPYLFMLPYLLFFLVFMAYPIFFSLELCFGKYKKGKIILTGLKNFRYILTEPLFYKTLGNTFVMMLIQVPLMILLALIFAYFLNQRKLVGKGIFRLIIFMPVLLDAVSYSIVFGNFFNNENGLINNVIRVFGGTAVPWLSVGWLAKLVVILVVTWKWTGYNTIILLSGLQSIPYDLYEAASIDGASGIQKFLHVTVPGVKPVLIFCIINSVNGMLQLFTEVYLLTAGGPTNQTMTIIQYLYEKGFRSFDFGVASAGSYVLVVIIAILTAIQLRAGKEEKT